MSRVGSKEPGDLKVLYLSGPEPLNNLSVLMKFGINPHNVWAIESDKRTFDVALKPLQESGIPLKLHLGTLSKFFETYNSGISISFITTLRGFPASQAQHARSRIEFALLSTS